MLIWPCSCGITIKYIIKYLYIRSMFITTANQRPVSMPRDFIFRQNRIARFYIRSFCIPLRIQNRIARSYIPHSSSFLPLRMQNRIARSYITRSFLLLRRQNRIARSHIPVPSFFLPGSECRIESPGLWNLTLTWRPIRAHHPCHVNYRSKSECIIFESPGYSVICDLVAWIYYRLRKFRAGSANQSPVVWPRDSLQWIISIGRFEAPVHKCFVSLRLN